MTSRLVRAAAGVVIALASSMSPTARMPAADATPAHPATAAVAPVRAAAGVSVTLDDLSPAVARPGQDLQLRLTVSARGRATAGPLTVRVLTGGRIGTREALATWLHDSGSRMLATTEVARTALASGVGADQQARVSITVPASEVARSSAYGVHPLAIECEDASGPLTTTRSVLPWLGATREYEPLRLAWVAPLTLPADPELTTGSASSVAAAWSRAIGPSGVLQGRLDAAAGTPVTWMVDPQVLVPPSRPGGLITAGGAAPTAPTTPRPAPTTTVSAATTTPRPAPASAAATTTASPTTTSSPATPAATSSGDPAPLATVAKEAQQLGTRLHDLPDHHQVWALPPGDPDSAALIAGHAGPDLRTLLWPAGTTALDKAVGTSVLDSVAWPADGAWPPGRRADWTTLDGGSVPTAALVSSSAFAPTKGRTPGAAQASPEGLPLLAYDQHLSTLTSGEGNSSDAQLVQEFLGDSMTLLGERPGRRRTALVAIPRSTTLGAPALRRLWSATSTAPWLRQVETSSILGEDREDRQVAGSTDAPSTPLVGQGVRRLERDVDTLAGLGSVLPSDQPATGSWAGGVRDLASARWRGRSARWTALRATVTNALDVTRGGVQVRPSTINFLADTGTIQITVTNTLPYPVHDVRLELVPGSPKLRVDQAYRSLSIGAGSRTTTQVRVTALGEGTVPLEARLSTPDGVTLGAPTTVDMNVRPTSVWVFALIAGIVGAILVLGLVRSLHRRPTRAERELGDKQAVAEAVLAPESTPKDSR